MLAGIQKNYRHKTMFELQTEYIYIFGRISKKHIAKILLELMNEPSGFAICYGSLLTTNESPSLEIESSCLFSPTAASKVQEVTSVLAVSGFLPKFEKIKIQ